MKKTYIVDSTCDNMRLDRWFRNEIGKIPQSFIEKHLRNGNLKVNKKNYVIYKFRKSDSKF